VGGPAGTAVVPAFGAAGLVVAVAGCPSVRGGTVSAFRPAVVSAFRPAVVSAFRSALVAFGPALVPSLGTVGSFAAGVCGARAGRRVGPRGRCGRPEYGQHRLTACSTDGQAGRFQHGTG
jgi:hypothetical protein